MAKFNMIFDLLVKDGVIDSCKQLLTPEAVSREVACLVHSEEYVDKFFNGHTTSQEQRVTGIPWSPGLVSRVRYETGGTVQAARAALQRGLACSTAGGTHHAFPGHGSGYCFLNDLAVAARLLGAGDDPRRVLIVDLDVHQEPETMRSFETKLDPADYEAGLLEIVAALRPDWNLDNLRLKPFAGLTNTLVSCCHAGDQESTLLFRLYGDGTDRFIDRDAEKRNMQMMHRAGCARPLVATFSNGIVYGFEPGHTVTKLSVRAPDVFAMVAAALARVHRITPLGPDAGDGSNPCRSCLWASLDKMMVLAPTQFDDPRQQKRFVSELRSAAQLRTELRQLREELEELGSPLVFCHNDLLLDNIIVAAGGRGVKFIDFEYGGVNHQAFDIGNHFNEFAGTEDVDYSLFPDREFQLRWLRCYLATYLSLKPGESPQPNGQTVEPTDLQVETLYVQANKFSLLSHFYWGVWALVQTRFSNIDFDYLEYAITRFSEYDRRREQLRSLALPVGNGVKQS
ncbi:ethanolamine kinase 1-like isoform X1 [Amphibalanus amphitrite]|nr:ethanolamine kinase 1-like isoform X1 [Amphibalanus amphitrite]